MEEELYSFLQAHDDDDASDGAWQAMIEDGVVFWNEDKGTTLDPFETFLEYCEEGDRRNV